MSVSGLVVVGVDGSASALGAVEGITRAEVSLGAIEVEHDGQVTLEQLREAIAVAGYSLGPAEENRRSLKVVG